MVAPVFGLPNTSQNSEKIQTGVTIADWRHQIFLTQLDAPMAPALLTWSASCLVLVLIDLRTRTLPNYEIAFGLLATWALLIAQFWNSPALLAMSLLLTLLVGFVFMAIALAAKGGFGFGDVKFATLAFLLPAVFGFESLFLAVFLSFAIASLYGLTQLIARRGNLASKLPFGPFMFIGSLLALFFKLL